MFAVLACGLAVGLGLSYAATAMLPRSAASPREQWAPYVPSYRPESTSAEVRQGVLTRAAAPLAPWVTRLGLPREARRRDLALLGRDTATHLAQQIATAFALSALGCALFVFLRSEGMPIPYPFVLTFVGIPAAYGFTAPGSHLKAEARAP